MTDKKPTEGEQLRWLSVEYDKRCAEKIELQDRVSELEAERNRLNAAKAERDAARNVIKQLRERFESMAVDYRQSDRDAVAAIARAEQAEAEIERLYESWHRQESRADAAEVRAEQAEATVEAVRGDVEYLRDQIKNGLRENDDGTFTLMWTQKQIDDAKAEAERLWQFFGPAAPRSAEPTTDGLSNDQITGCVTSGKAERQAFLESVAGQRYGAAPTSAEPDCLVVDEGGVVAIYERSAEPTSEGEE